MKFFFSLIVFLFVFSSLVFSATLAERVLKDELGIVALGMGGAFSAVADNNNAIFYNPAGLNGLAFEYSNGLTDYNRDLYKGSRYDIFSLGSLAYASWAVTNSSGQNVSAWAYGFGQRGYRGINWGLNYKTASWNTSGGGQGNSFDFGTLFRITPGFNLAIVGRDIVSSPNFAVSSSWRYGLALMPFDNRITLAYDIEVDRSRTSESLNYFGAQLNVLKGLSLRLGSWQNRSTFGLSADIPFCTIEYAMLSDASLLNANLHRLGFSLRITKEKKRSYSMVKSIEYALIDLHGPISGGTDRLGIISGGNRGLDSVLADIRMAAKDNGIDGLMFKVGSFDESLGGMAMAEEIREEIKEAKKKGKKIVAYLDESGTGLSYYIISGADKIIMAPEVAAGGLGTAIEITRLKGLLNNWGIDFQIVSEGKYKTTFNSFSGSMTKDQKDMVANLVSDMHRRMLRNIALERKLELKRIKELSDGRLITAREAKEYGLVDDLGYFEKAKEVGAEIFDTAEKISLINKEDLDPLVSEDSLFGAFNKVAVIEIEGDIITGRSYDNFIFGGRTTGADTILDNIESAAQDIRIKVIMIRINSGGGSPIASGQIYEALLEAKKKGKKVVVSIGEMAASGGYYIAVAGDKIVADPSSICGSIGVWGGKLVLKDLFKTMNISAEVVKEGDHADMYSVSRPFTEQEIKYLKKIMDETYDIFVQKVVAGRKMKLAEVYDLAQGKVYTGSQARDLNLIDDLGGFSEAIRIAKEMGEISTEPQLIYYRRPQFGLQLGFGIKEALGIKEGFWPQMSPGLMKETLYK